MGVACRNAQLGTHEEEDDLEHAGLLTSLIVRANLHIRLELCTSPGNLEGFFSEDISGALPSRC